MKKLLLGIDEAGRGPLAGPVAVGAVVLLTHTLHFGGLKDSKKLSVLARDAWFAKIKIWQKEKKIRYAVSLVSERIIDKEGIVYAVSLGIKRCLDKLHVSPRMVSILLDGGLKAPRQFQAQRTIIRGDEKMAVIALASICAKVTRDRYMARLSKRYPGYALDVHKGYGTQSHRQAIRKYGPSPIHRRTFLKPFP